MVYRATDISENVLILKSCTTQVFKKDTKIFQLLFGNPNIEFLKSHENNAFLNLLA